MKSTLACSAVLLPIVLFCGCSREEYRYELHVVQTTTPVTYVVFDRKTGDCHFQKGMKKTLDGTVVYPDGSVKKSKSTASNPSGE